MSAGGEPLAELLQALAPPLEYLAADDFRRLDQTRLPLSAWLERVARARAAERSAPGLLELGQVIERLAAGVPPDEQAVLLRRAHALLPELRSAVGATPAGTRPEAAPAAGGGRPDPASRSGDAPADGDAADRPGRRGPWTEYTPTSTRLDEVLAALAQPVANVRAVGPKRAAELGRFGLATVEDLLWHLPFRYEDRRAVCAIKALRPGEDATTTGTVESVRQSTTGRTRRRILEVVLRDGDAALVLVWFQQVPWFAGRFTAGQRLLVHGRVEPALAVGSYRMAHPEVTALTGEDDLAKLPPVMPIYEKPTAMPVAIMRRIVHAAVEAYGARVPAALPAELAARRRILDPARALRRVHQPSAEADLPALQHATSLAHRSLIFDELFFLQLGLALRRSATVEEPGTAFPGPGRLGAALEAHLPFALTGAQRRASAEIAADLARPHPMRRLLQGDVGSGKTLVALLAALVVIDAGWQAALMAPTELLAEQHHATVAPLLAPLGLEAVLLTGAVKGRARRDALAGLAGGSVAIAVGTHALIQEGVSFARLGLAVVDEQHRFGVMQRAALQRQGGGNAIDVLVMSATPIPRTLALTLYGDLAISTLDELPPGRTPIATELCRERQRERMYGRIRDEVAAGHQAYVVYPLVEESAKPAAEGGRRSVALKAATTMVRELACGPLAGLRLDLVHGRMKADEKDAVMRRFKAREFDVLVSTTVIEVGIDVPNATVIAVEHAERFGLAQLHQLRGRVGRGSAPGHCLLMVPDWLPADAWQRLRVLEGSTDGFAIAEADLKLRGPGDFLGTRQAGLPPFRVANLVRDTALLRAARDEALAWLERDPDLSKPESAVVRAMLRHRWAGRLELARVG